MRPMAAWRRARCGPSRLETAVNGRPWEPAWLPDVETLLARDFTPIGDHRGGAAYRLRAAAGLLRRFQIRDHIEAAGAGGGVMNEPLARIRGGVHARGAHTTARSDTSPAPHAISTMSRPCRARLKRVAGAQPACACPHLPHRSVAGAGCARRHRRDHGRRYSRQERHRPDPQRRAALAAGIVEYEGQPVAAIAAATLDQARAATRSWSISTYEPLPAVLTIEEAIARESYVSPPQTMARGEVEPALAGAPHRLTGELRCGGQDHFYLEGQIALAVPGEGGDMQVWSSTQHPTEVQHGVAHLLGLPFNAVTVEVRRMGGAFGGKESQATIIAGIAAVLAWKARRPVKLRPPARRRHAGDRQAPSFPDPLRRRGRRRGAHSCARPHAGRRRRQRRRSHAGRADTRAVSMPTTATSFRTCVFADCRAKPTPCRTRRSAAIGGPQGMLAIETIIDVIARAARPARRPCGGAISTASAATT